MSWKAKKFPTSLLRVPIKALWLSRLSRRTGGDRPARWNSFKTEELCHTL